ncbi:recombination endonuclease VII subfamily [Streptomyces sp. SPB074]|nr:recombination endonuclease VII subfamily [Streptomyces sp. SPB074]
MCASHYARWRRSGTAGDAFTVRRRNPGQRDSEGRKQCRDCDRWLDVTRFNRKRGASDGLAAECGDCVHARVISRRYGVDLTWYLATLESQEGGCAICGSRSNGRRLHIDHDHTHCGPRRGCAGCVRGLLCSSCNTGVGNFRDNVDLLKAAISYLERE